MGGDPIRAGFVLHFPPERQEQAIRFCQIVGVGIPDLVEKRSYSSALHPLNRPRRTDRAAPADGRLGPPENTEPESPPPPGTSLGEVVGVGAAGEFAPADQVLVTHSDPQAQVLSPDNPDGNPQSSDPRTTLGINRPLLRHPPPSGPMSTAATRHDVSREIQEAVREHTQIWVYFQNMNGRSGTSSRRSTYHPLAVHPAPRHHPPSADEHHHPRPAGGLGDYTRVTVSSASWRNQGIEVYLHKRTPWRVDLEFANTLRGALCVKVFTHDTHLYILAVHAPLVRKVKSFGCHLFWARHWREVLASSNPGPQKPIRPGPAPLPTGQGGRSSKVEKTGAAVTKCTGNVESMLKLQLLQSSARWYSVGETDAVAKKLLKGAVKEKLNKQKH